jgi:hypothetical protein
MRSELFNGLLILLISATITNVLLHWIIVCPALYRDGARPPTGLLPWKIFNELNRYREILRARSDSLSPYYVILLFRWFNAILAIAVGFMWLTLATNPPA